MNLSHQFWHVAPRNVRESIRTDGLRGNPDDNDPQANGGVWAFSDRERAVSSDNFDVWRIHGREGFEHGSLSSEEWGRNDPVYVSYKTISPDRLVLEGRET